MDTAAEYEKLTDEEKAYFDAAMAEIQPLLDRLREVSRWQ